VVKYAAHPLPSHFTIDQSYFVYPSTQPRTNNCEMSQIPTEPHVGEDVPVGLHGGQSIAEESPAEHSFTTAVEPHVPAQPQGGLIQVDDVSVHRNTTSLSEKFRRN